MTNFNKLDEIHQHTVDRFQKFGLIGAAHGTTRQHYEKYQQMCKASGFSLKHTRLNVFGLEDFMDLQRRYVADRNLNNIPLRIFDGLYEIYRIYYQKRPGSARTASDYTCCMKWLLLYEVLMLEPEFVD